MRVLLADDDAAMLRIVSRWLEVAGYEVRQAGDGLAALAAIEADCPDFLITDWDMPRMDGLDLCRRVRQLDLPQYVHILMMSVKAARNEMVTGLEVGADDFLTKPVDQAELLARLQAGSRTLALERRLSLMAHTDPLTGLVTRRAFYEGLQKEWERARRFHLPLSCVMIDLDFFKRVNDLHGHAAGDSVLKAIAAQLTACCRGSDRVCRYGGEEFCVMLPETREQDAAVWAERARRQIAEVAVLLGDEPLHVTCSLGVAQRHDDTQTCEQLIDQADQALLGAKSSGRDRVVRFESLAESSELELEDGGTQRSLFHGVLARHVMTPAVACLRDEESVGQAAEFFLCSRINSSPVIDARGQMAGILSEKDLMAALVSIESWNRPIREVMKPNVICYPGGTPIRVIYEFLCRVSIRRVVIVENSQPIGTISRATLLRWFRNTVIGKGLLGAAGTPPSQLENDAHRSRDRLAETAREMGQQVADLETRLGNAAEDPVPYVVGGVTRMQELLDDLLAYSRYANLADGAEAALNSLVLDASNGG